MGRLDYIYYTFLGVVSVYRVLFFYIPIAVERRKNPEVTTKAGFFSCGLENEHCTGRTAAAAVEQSRDDDEAGGRASERVDGANIAIFRFSLKSSLKVKRRRN